VLIAGALMPLGYAPFGLFPLVPLLLAVLFHQVSDCGPRRAFWRAWLFGFAMFGVGVSWVYNSIHEFGHAWAPAAVALTALFAAILAGFLATGVWLAVVAARGDRRVLWLGTLPAAWALLEWIRGWFLTGFPWLSVGYSQIDGPLAGYAEYVGVYGVSWATALVAGLALVAWYGKGWRRWPALLFIVVVVAGGPLVERVEWTQRAGNDLRVAVIQGNFSQDIKWLPEYRDIQLQTYAKLTRDNWDADLVLWPETAIPALLDEVQESYLEVLAGEARRSETTLALGISMRDPSPLRFYNGFVATGIGEGLYHKVHLVPLGEFWPFKSVISALVPGLDLPRYDLSPGGPDQPLLTVAGVPVAVSICYEDAFGADIARQMPEAQLLLNVSNDAWFGRFAPHQHMEIARMRARETERYLVRATNTGVSAIVDPRGELLKTSPQFEQYVMTGYVHPRSGATPYVLWRDWPVAVGAMLVLVLGAWLRGRGAA